MANMPPAPKLPLKMRLALWFVARRLRKEFRMKPLPKWLSWVSAIAGLFGAGGALTDAIPPKYAAIVGGVAAIIGSLSHSATGNGVYVPPPSDK